MKNTYRVAGHLFNVCGENLCKRVESIPGFAPFEQADADVLFSYVEDNNVPDFEKVQYEFSYEDVTGKFGRTQDGFLLSLTPENKEPFYLWCKENDTLVKMFGNWDVRLYRFAMWIGLGVMVAPLDTVAIHSSCIVYNNKAVLFLGESGTGKSTHTRLWRETIDGAFLLNDDSPVLKVENGKVWAYGSPWSGKTPCYRQEKYELAACVRLSQAPHNKIKKLSVLEGYAAIHPSCPPEFAYDSYLYDNISSFINKLLSNVPFYHLACLPNNEAALLSFKTIFANETDTE